MKLSKREAFAKALYESLSKRSQEFGFAAPHDVISWENQIPGYKDCLIAVAGDLLNSEVIEGGHTVPTVPNQTRHRDPDSPESNGVDRE